MVRKKKEMSEETLNQLMFVALVAFFLYVLGKALSWW